MFNKVKSVMPKREFVLLVQFESGITKYYDIKPLFDKWKVFNNLKSMPELYNQVKVDLGGYGVSWNDEIDLSCDELWENGIEVQVEETILS